MLGVFLAALSAATFAFNAVSLRRGVLTGSVLQALSITVPIGVPLFLAVALATGAIAAFADFSSGAIALLIAVGVVHFVGGRYCNYRGARAIGANLSGPLLQLSLVVSLVLAVLLLGETLTLLRMLGIALLVLGPLLMQQSERKSGAASEAAAADATIPAQSDMPPRFRPRYAEGVFFTLLCAVVYGATPVAIRPLVQGGGASAGLVAGLISYAAGTVAVGLLLLWPGQFRNVISMQRESAKWFVFSGLFVCISQMFLFVALALAPVAVVTAVLQLQLVFRYLFSRLLNPHHEVFGGKMILATILSVIGAAALSVSTEIVLTLAPLPDWFVTAARWQWP